MTDDRAHRASRILGGARLEGLVPWVLPLLVFAAAYGMQRSVALLGLDLHHDDLMFDAARRMLNGEIPFRDFFYQYNLGTVLFHVLALKVFGPKIASLKIATAIVYAVIATLVYLCSAVQGARWAGLGWAALWSALSPFYMPALNGFHPWSTVYMMAAVMGGALLLSAAMRGRAGMLAAAAGASLNLAFWFKQVAGLQILVVLGWLISNLWRQPANDPMGQTFRRMLIGYIAGGLVSALPFFGYIAAHDLFVDWWRSAFLFNGFFAATGHSSSGLFAFVRTFIPVSRDLGYWSVLWAILPPFVLLTAIIRHDVAGTASPAAEDAAGRTLGLYVALGLAGWAEYFPLPHEFHTQLFMAPAFVVLAVWQSRWNSWSDVVARAHPVIAAAFALVLVMTGYEAARHVYGIARKTAQPTQLLGNGTPVAGLRLAPLYARSFQNFYAKFTAAKRAQGDLPCVPMSVDPLRALLPGDLPERTTFKMGLDWTWPNEIVEPGFNARLLGMITQRKALVYGDSLVAIPGYIPIALLEMPSPMTRSHTLYVPSADPAYKEPPVIVTHDLLQVVRTVLELPTDDMPILLKLGEAAKVPYDDVDQLHVSIIKASDLPARLTRLEYEKFLALIPDQISRSAQLYRLGPSGDYELVQPLSNVQMLMLAQFMLFRGKLFEAQDRPAYFTTLSAAESQHPFLVGANARREVGIVWRKSITTLGPEVGPWSTLYLALPPGAIAGTEAAVLYVQLVMKDRTTRDFYLYYLSQ